jgi:NADH-quinone oxidoreductase subunit N
VSPLAIAAIAGHHIHGPHINYAELSPFIALAAGALVVLLLGLVRAAAVRERLVPTVTLAALGAAVAVEIWRFPYHAQIISRALSVDDLALCIDLVCAGTAAATVIMSLRGHAPGEAGHGEYHALLLFSLLGMAILVSAQELVTLFIGIELLSLPLYILCASEHRREGSLESGLKYLIIGSVGSATLVYGLAMIYGATGSTFFAQIARAVSTGRLSGGVLGDPLLFGGLALVIVGFAFKSSVAPFHQWTPDVYEGAPTPITSFMATATKAAALGVFLRFFDQAAIGAQNTWAPALATVAAVTIIVGNVGALGQSSLKRMLGYSGVAQAGYMLAGVIVGSQLGIKATVLYLIAYTLMNVAAFAVVVAVQRASSGSDELGGFAGLGARAPLLAGAMTVAMLALAGIPGTVGFIGKLQLIHALVSGNYTWLAIILVVGSMISLGYYLRVVATMWMGAAGAQDAALASAGGPVSGPGGLAAGPGGLAPIAGGSPEADDLQPPGSAGDAPQQAAAAGAQRAGATGAQPAGAAAGRRPSGGTRPAGGPEIALVAAVAALACVFFGIIPEPLFSFAAHAGQAIAGLL